MTKIAGSGSESGSISQRHGSEKKLSWIRNTVRMNKNCGRARACGPPRVFTSKLSWLPRTSSQGACWRPSSITFLNYILGKKAAKRTAIYSSVYLVNKQNNQDKLRQYMIVRMKFFCGVPSLGLAHRVPTPTPPPLPLREGRQVEII
jgi:hypothetical protein